MTEAEYDAWRKHVTRSERAGASILLEMGGWADAMPDDSDEQLLRWARHFLPKVRTWNVSHTEVVGS